MTIFVEKGEKYPSIRDKVVNATGLEVTCWCNEEGNPLPHHVTLENSRGFKIYEETYITFPPKHLIKLKGKL